MRPVYTLFAAIFVMSIGFGIMTPAVSLYAVLGFGVNEWELGVLGALVSIPYTIMSTVFGRYSDRVGRRPLILAGVSIYALVALAYLFAPSFAFLAILRLIEGFCFSLVWPAAEACVGDLSSNRDRPRLIGYYSVAWSAGYMLGPFLLSFLLTFASIGYSFILAALLTAVSLPMVLFIRGTVPKGQETAVEEDPTPRIPTVAIFLAMVIWGMGQLTYFFLIPAYTVGIGFPAAYAGYLIGTVALFRTLVFIAFPALVRVLKASMLPLAMVLMAVSMLTTWVAQDFTVFLIAASVLGLAFGMIYGYSLTHMLGRPAKGLYAGIFESAIGIGQIAGPLSMGYLGFIFLPSTPYLAMGIVSLASTAAVTLALLPRHRKAP